MYGAEDALRSLLTVTATAGDWGVELAGSEIATGDGEHLSRIYDTPRRGRLQVTAVLARPGEPALATVSTELEIRTDWIWGVHVHLAEEDPAELCLGCMGSTAVAVPDEVTPGIADSLYLVWGGNSVRDPVVY